MRTAVAVDIAETIALVAVVVGITGIACVLAAIAETLWRMVVRRGEVRRARTYVAALRTRPPLRPPGRHRADWSHDDGEFLPGLANAAALVLGLSLVIVLCCGGVIVHVAE